MFHNDGPRKRGAGEILDSELGISISIALRWLSHSSKTSKMEFEVPPSNSAINKPLRLGRFFNGGRALAITLSLVKG
jgi:hypothetical protein